MNSYFISSEKVSGFIRYFKTDVWRIRLDKLPPVKAFFFRLLRIILMVIRGFRENQGELRASSLTFYSVLSIVPMVAMAFGISKGFGFEKILERQLLENFPGQEEVLIRVINLSRTLLEQTRGGMIAGIGLTVLMWTVIRVLVNIEHAFNHIWKIPKQRTFSRKISDYLSIMMICPLLMIVSSSANVFITTQVTNITENVAVVGMFSPVIFPMLKLLPYGLIWTLFTIIYIFMPNTKVSFFSGLLGGLIAGTIYQIAQWGYIKFQIGVANYNAIYGSFAALPLFLVWIQFSWLLVLFGAEISFAHQKVDIYEAEPDCRKISFRLKKVSAIEILCLIIRNFSKGGTPFTVSEISHQSDIPLLLVQKITAELVDLRILSEVYHESDTEPAYQPASDIYRFTVVSVLESLEQKGVDTLPVRQSQELSEILKELKDTLENSTANKRLADIQN